MAAVEQSSLMSRFSERERHTHTHRDQEREASRDPASGAEEIVRPRQQAGRQAVRQPALRRETWRRAGDAEEDRTHHNRII